MDNLQQIAIDRIVPSPEPVRSTWDENKMAELVASVQENGIIVPVKVRPIDGGKLEIVYGHRRVEAARRVGFEAVPAVVEVLTPLDAFVQAGLENKQRDDMTPAEEAEWYTMLMNKHNMTRQGIADRTGISYDWIATCIAFAKVDGLEPLHRATDTKDTVHKGQWIRAAIDDPDIRRAVAQKVIDEGLTSRQTKQLAEAIAQAPTEQARKRLLEWEFSPVIHHPEEVREHGAHSPLWQGNGQTEQQKWDATPEAKVIIKGVLDTITAVRKLMAETLTVASGEKFSPEARRFIAERLRKFRAEIDKTIEELEV